MKEYKLLKNIDLEEYRLIGSIIKLIEYYTLGNGQRVPTERLVAHWYLEEVKEEIPKWLFKAYNDFEDDKRCILWWPNGREAFNKSILDNMPKQEQQKITKKEVDNWAYVQLRYDQKEVGIRAITNFLISKWLLEE